MFWAAHFARPEPLACLLEKGADVNKPRNTENNTNSPLHEASARCAKCVILLLGVPNANVTAKNKVRREGDRPQLKLRIQEGIIIAANGM